MFIIVEGSTPDQSSVFGVLSLPINEYGFVEVIRMSDGRKFRLAPDHKIVETIPARFLGSKAVPDNAAKNILAAGQAVFTGCGEAVRPGAVKAKSGKPQRSSKPKK